MTARFCGTLKSRARVTVSFLLPEPFRVPCLNKFNLPSGVSAPPLCVPHRRGKWYFSVQLAAPVPHFYGSEKRISFGNLLHYHLIQLLHAFDLVITEEQQRL